jgi:hypothetical protein
MSAPCLAKDCLKRGLPLLCPEHLMKFIECGFTAGQARIEHCLTHEKEIERMRESIFYHSKEKGRKPQKI